MLILATTAMASAAASCSGALAPLVGAFFLFELCVGMYFPLIGTLRSKYLPDAYRGVIMNIFGIPLNLIVVSWQSGPGVGCTLPPPFSPLNARGVVEKGARSCDIV